MPFFCKRKKEKISDCRKNQISIKRVTAHLHFNLDYYFTFLDKTNSRKNITYEKFNT